MDALLSDFGLDGIRILDLSSNRTLGIYPLETVTRWEVLDSSIFAFWSKSSVDFEPKRVRLQSNSYTTSTLLQLYSLKKLEEIILREVPDEAAKKCMSFNPFNRRHHYRNCDNIFCDKCSQDRIALNAEENAPQVRVCDRSMEEIERNCKSSWGLKTNGSSRQMREVECPACTVHLQVQVPTSGSETIECGVSFTHQCKLNK